MVKMVIFDFGYGDFGTKMAISTQKIGQFRSFAWQNDDF